MFPHCMYPVRMRIPGLEGVNIPDVCCNQPETSNVAFCKIHRQLAIQKEIPTDIKGFIKFCGDSALGIIIYCHDTFIDACIM